MTITFDQLKTEVLRLAQENPNKVIEGVPSTDELASPSCFYNQHVFAYTTVEPCIFGQAFINLGDPVPESLEGENIYEVIRVRVLGASTDDRLWAIEVQGKQDMQIPWGRAVGVIG